MKPRSRRRKLNKPDTIIPQLELEEIIGVTVKNCNGLASNFETCRCVYIAGCVAVVYNVEFGTQAHLVVIHRVPMPLNSVAISHDGRYVAAGEIGKQASVLVWDCEALCFILELKGHQHGVASIDFSRDGKHLVSAESTSDGHIYLWHWRSGTMIAKIKANSSNFTVVSVNFTPDAKSVVIAGNNQLKVCSIRPAANRKSSSRAGSLIFGKPVGFATQKGSSFISIVCTLRTVGDSTKMLNECSSIFALTDTGILCQLSPGFLVKKSVNLKVEKGYALSASRSMIACACSSGIVQLFAIDTLIYVGEMLYSPDRNKNDEIDILGQEKMAHADTQCASTFPDAVACQFSTNEKLVVIYGDHSLYVWDVHDACKPIRICVLISHSAFIWDLKALACENNHNASVACAAKGCSGGISFATCSGDGTIRIWDFTFQSILSAIITDSHMTSETINTAILVSSGIIETEAVEVEINKQGFRSMEISPDGKYLAAGDITGNLLIYNLKSSTCVCIQDAHGAEVLSVSFSSQYRENNTPSGLRKGTYLFASGGLDGIVHLYNVERDFVVIGSIDHSTPVTVVQLASSGSRIISGNVDGSLIIHDIDLTTDGCKLVRHHHMKACSGALYDIFVDPMVEFAVTVAQGTDICTFDILSGERVHSFKRSEGFGNPIKVIMDPSCSYLLLSYSNKMICVYDYLTGELVAQAVGHSEVVTGIIFLPNCKHIVSVGGDGCIFVWKVPASLSERMMQRLKENSRPLSPLNIAQPLIRGAFLVREDDDIIQDSLTLTALENSNCFSKRELSFSNARHKSSAFRFSISRLPKWAQKEVVSSETISCVTDTISSQKDVFNTPLDRHDQVGACLRNKEECVHDLALEDITTINNNVSSTDTCNSMIRYYGNSEDKSFSKKRWQTIYTVCLDLMSPEVSNHNSSNMALSSINLSHSTSEDRPNVESIIEAKHQEYSLFEQHFSNLSAVQKAEKQSTVSKRCSSRFIVRRCHVTSSKTLLNTRDEYCNQNAFLGIASEKLSFDDGVDHVQEHNMMIKSEKLLPTEPSTLVEQDVVTQCREALSSLNAAAESVHGLFYKLMSLCPEEDSPASPATVVLHDALMLLPSIAEKIHAVYSMAHRKTKKYTFLHHTHI